MMSANSSDRVNSRSQPPDHPAELNQGSEDSLSSPDVDVAFLTGSNGFADYVARLRCRNRCTVVAYNDRGAQCVAVATADDRPAGLIMHVSI